MEFFCFFFFFELSIRGQVGNDWKNNFYFHALCHWKKFPHDHVHVQLQKYHIHKKKFRIHKTFPYSYPQNFAINYTCQQIFHIHHDFVQPSLQNKFFTISMPPKIQEKVHPTNITNHQHCQNSSQLECPQNSSQDSSNNITNYQYCQNSISHQHCPDYTMTKRNNTSSMLQSQHFQNMINLTMPSKFQKERSPKKIFKRKNLLNKSSKGQISMNKSPWTNLKWTKSPWTHLQKEKFPK